jgi:UDP-GlcNAc:undecaprenyl-phosphate GlcNAc-1-phosphate transferase
VPYLYYLVLPLVISFLSTPLLSQVARKKGLMDKPGLHKTHREAKPFLGGLSIFLAVVVAVFVLLPASPAVLSLMGGGAILVIVGLLDDIYNLKPLVKLAGQLAAAI